MNQQRQILISLAGLKTQLASESGTCAPVKMEPVRVRAKCAALLFLSVFAWDSPSLHSAAGLPGSGRDLAHHIDPHTSPAVYFGTPAYPPAAVFGQYPASRTFAVGPNGIALDGSSSFTAMDNATLSYAWTLVSGPSAGTFSNPREAATRFAASVPGTYVLQLNVTDKRGKSGSRQVKYGAVRVGPDGLVQVPDPAISRVLGPLTMSGTSPWPWYDVTERSDADVLIPYQTVYPAASARLSGKVTVALKNGNTYVPPAVSGTGTHFTSELKIGDGIAFAWQAPD